MYLAVISNRVMSHLKEEFAIIEIYCSLGMFSVFLVRFNLFKVHLE